MIRRLLAGELDAADVPLAAAVAGAQAGDAELLTLDELAARVGVPAPLLDAVAREGLIVAAAARRRGGLHRGRRRRAARRACGCSKPASRSPTCSRWRAVTTTRRARSRTTRSRCSTSTCAARSRTSDLADDEKAERLVDAFRTLLPTVTTLVAHHFRSVLLEVAQEHLEAVGDPSELAAAHERARMGRTRPTSTPVLGRDGSLPQGDAKRDAVEGMFDRLAPRYDRMNRVISLGLDRAGAAARSTRSRPSRGGTRARPRVRHRRPLPRPRRARLHAGRHRLLRRDARGAHVDDAARPRRRCRAPVRRRRAFDGVVCGFALRNFVDLDARVRRVRPRAARGGRFAALDATVPTNPLMRAGNAVWFRGAVPLLGRLLAHDADAYRYLPKTTAYLPAAPELEDAPRRAGFRDVRRTHAHRRLGAAAHGDPRVTTTPAPARLRAVTREVDPRRRRARAASTRAASRGCTTAPASSRRASRPASTADDADALLAAIDADDPLGLPGTGAIAVGALPVRSRRRRASW